MDPTPRLPDQRVRFTGDGCLFVLDDEGVFFSTARQELLVFNTPATLIWCCAEEGCSTDEIVGRYRGVYGLGEAEAHRHVALALERWWGLGHIEAPDVRGAPHLPFTAALARLLHNDALRAAFATAPRETATLLNLEARDLDAFLALDPAELEAQVRHLRDRPRGRETPPTGAETLFSATAADGRTVLGLAVDGRMRGVAASPLERHYRLLDTNFRLRFTSAAHEACVHPAFEHLAIAPAAESDVILDIVESGSGHVILDGLVPVGYCPSLEQLTPAIKSLVGLSAINRHRFFLELHAGVVWNGERCVLLPGASGSGKSTLTAGLVAAGFGYLSDEVALLENDTLELRPVPLALGVKRGALAAVAGRWPEVAGLAVHRRVDGELVRYLGPPAERSVPSERTYPAGWLVFPRYGAGLATELRPISRPEALRRLMRECMVLPELLDESRVGNLVRWMRGLECFELPMNSLDQAIKLVASRCRPR